MRKVLQNFWGWGTQRAFPGIGFDESNSLKRFFSHQKRVRSWKSVRSGATMSWNLPSQYFSSSFDARAPFLTRLTTAIPLSAGLALLAFLHFRRVKRREEGRRGEREASTTHLALYRFIPWRLVSRSWGGIHSLPIPKFFRPAVLGAYAKTFHCDLADAVEPDIRNYRNLGEFFRRRLRPESRPIPSHCECVSPCDGQVLSCGPVAGGKVEQVKGMTYSLNRFLGVSGEPEDLLEDPQHNTLYQVVIYLAPGDYHQFFSPVDWVVSKRKHFPGDLLSVNPYMAAWIRDLFVLNERAVYFGSWRYGFFSMTAVGATNVGSIRVPFDPALLTNRAWSRRHKVLTTRFSDEETALKRGELFGEFNLGSTIVLLFEAPKGLEMVKPTDGGHIRMGEVLLGGSSK